MIQQGWYPDPDNSLQERYWTGTEWAGSSRSVRGVFVNSSPAITRASRQQEIPAFGEQSGPRTQHLSRRPISDETRPPRTARMARAWGWVAPIGVGLILVLFASVGGANEGNELVPSSNLESEWQSDDPTGGWDDNDQWEMGVDGNGFSVTCQDGTTSASGGKSGACSHHGGVR